MNQTTDANLNGTFQQQSLVHEEIIPENKDKRDAKMEAAITALRRRWTGSEQQPKHRKHRR